jgi:hypothetical protein
MTNVLGNEDLALCKDSCKSYYYQGRVFALTIARAIVVAGITNYVAWNCQAAQNAHGGSCHFYNDNPQVGKSDRSIPVRREINEIL